MKMSSLLGSILTCLRKRKRTSMRVKSPHGKTFLGGGGPPLIGQYQSRRTPALSLHFDPRVVFGLPFGSIGFSALLAPKVALYTRLACRAHIRPEYVPNDLALSFSSASNFSVDSPIPYVSDDSQVTLEPVYVPYFASLNYIQDDSDSERRCASDPVVQATAARLSAGLRQVYLVSRIS